jgi:hypothetical protein
MRAYISHRIQGLDAGRTKSVENLVSRASKMVYSVFGGGAQVVLPLELEYDFAHSHEIVEHDLRLIASCELFIVDLAHGNGAGSMMELIWARRNHGLITVGILNEGEEDQLSCWVSNHLAYSATLKTLPKCLHSIKHNYDILSGGRNGKSD